MACIGGPTIEQVRENEAGSRREANDLARTQALLCEAVSMLEEHGLRASMSAPLKRWATKHESYEKERTKQRALKKLTAKERRALGLEE